MQYISKTTDDLKPGYSTFVLQKHNDNIKFFAYKGENAVKATKQGIENNDYLQAYFLRKGFSDAILDADPNVLEPSYKDREYNDVHPKTKEEAISQIYKNELNISGFKFKENATDEQKEEAFGKLINCFVSTSKNLDFSSDKNLFMVQGNGREVIYNHGGSKSMQIDGVDVQEKMGLKTRAVAVMQAHRNRMMQSKFKGM